MSETKRHNTRRNTERPPAQHLGSFRRELLLHLAIKEAVYRVKWDRSGKWPLAQRGYRGVFLWKPADALRPGVTLTPTLAAKTSGALRALDELGLVRRRRGQHGGRTLATGVTAAGQDLAIEILERQGQSPTAAAKDETYIGNAFLKDPVALAESLLAAELPNLSTLLVQADYARSMSEDQARRLWWLGQLRRRLRSLSRSGDNAAYARMVLQEVEDLVFVVDQGDPGIICLYRFACRIASARKTGAGLPKWAGRFQVFDLAPGPEEIYSL